MSNAAIPTKSIRALYQEQLDVFSDVARCKASLLADRDRWDDEEKGIITSGAVRNERKVAMVGVLQTKKAMVPHALEAEDKRAADALGALNELYGPLINEAEKVMEHVLEELRETCAATASVYCENEEGIALAASALFDSTEIGRRIREAHIEAPRGPLQSQGEAQFIAGWYDRAVKIQQDWERSKLRAGNVPAAPAA